MFHGARPLRVEWARVFFARGRLEHRARREVYAEEPHGVSFTHGIAACGVKGEIRQDRLWGRPCRKCEKLAPAGSTP